MQACRRFRAFITSGLLCAFLIALGLAAAPQMHERFHADADSANHECAVTLIAAGKCAQGHVTPMMPPPQPAALVEKISVLTPIDRATPFLRAAIFEHAPPVSA
ncbi:MAG: hypothetical protein H0X40_05350 [Chthoniobacterales bacterium]|nr:hypothetical protein [Chthoniobacterales bacterium]